MLETTHHQAHSRGQTDEDDGEADHHGHLDVHLHHAVDVPDRTAGLPTADGVVRGVVSARTLEIFLEQNLQLICNPDADILYNKMIPLIPQENSELKLKYKIIKRKQSVSLIKVR